MRSWYVLVALCAVACVSAQNSMRKIRPEPSALAARAGSAIAWRADLATALREAEREQKPVFWYVPTLRGSRMDRKPEIDRYMLMGPFSWPGVIGVLNDRMIPVRAAAQRAEQQRYGLRPGPLGTDGSFIEPGFLVLTPDGKVAKRCDQITTFHPAWWRAMLEPFGAWSWPGPDVTSGPWRPARVAEQLAGATDAWSRYLHGAALFHSGHEARAVEVWQQLGRDLPDDPSAWKAAAEAEGHGPLVRGFEVYGAIDPAAIAGMTTSQSAAGVYPERELWRRSVRFLLAMQRSDGGWVDCRYDFGGTDSLPNVYVAVSALATMALLDADAKRVGVDAERIDAAVRAGLAYCTDRDNYNLEDRDELAWSHIYTIRLIERMLAGGNDGELRQQLQRSVTELCTMQPDSGAWFHEYQNPFVTASVLVALKVAADAGAEVSEGNVSRGVRALIQCRSDNGAYSYGFGRSRRTQVAAAAGRMPLCEHALSLWGAGRENALENALKAGFDHHDELASVRKYDDHAHPLGYGGFFFWYDMHSRCEALLGSKDDASRAERIAAQRELILGLPELDGCFVDSHELGRVYGTAVALICLALLAD